MNYDFKAKPEFIWSVVTAGITAAAQIVSSQAVPTDIDGLRVAVIALLAGIGRAIIGALIATGEAVKS